MKRPLAVSLKGRVSTSDLLPIYIDLLMSNGIGVSFVPGDINHKIFTNGFSFSGSIKNALDGLANACSFDWSIQDRGLVILNEKQTIPGPITVGRRKGIIGSVVKSRNKVEFTTFTDPDLRVGRHIILQSDAEGELSLKLLRVNHFGDSWEGVWESRCEGLLL